MLPTWIAECSVWQIRLWQAIGGLTTKHSLLPPIQAYSEDARGREQWVEPPQPRPATLIVIFLVLQTHDCVVNLARRMILCR